MSASPETSELPAVEDGGEQERPLPVLASRSRVAQARQSATVLAGGGRAPAAMAVQAAAAAAGGFMAGAAMVRFVHRRRLAPAAGARRRRSGGRLARRGRGGAELVQIVGSRSLLLDVHLLAGPGKDL